MIHRTIHILDWTAVFLFSIDGEGDSDVYQKIVRFDAPDSIIEQVMSNLKSGRLNEGFTYSNPSVRASVVYIGPTSSGQEFLSSFVHELAHLTCDICVTDNISLVGEKIAYVQGEIAYRLSDIVCHFSCDHCRAQ